MKAHGFMLIDLMVALFISSVVSIILLGAFSQSVKFQKMVDDFLDIGMRTAVMQNQLERDLMGAFIPIKNENTQQSVQSDTEADNKKDQKEQPNESISSKKQENTETEKQSVKKLFYANTKNGMLDQLTFITTNPLVIYWSEKTGFAQPKCVRVVYQMHKDLHHEHAWTLTRQEGFDLDLKAYQNKENVLRSYQLCAGIKHISVEYIVAETAQEEKKKPEAEEEKIGNKKTAKIQQPTYTIAHEWNSDEVKDDNKKKQKNESIPHFVRITFELWDNHYQHTRKNVVTIPLVVSEAKTHKDEKNEEKPSQEQKSNNQKSETAKKESATPKQLQDIPPDGFEASIELISHLLDIPRSPTTPKVTNWVLQL